MTATVTGVLGLRQLGVVPKVASLVREKADGLSAAMLESILHEVPAFTASGNPDVIPELKAHLPLHIDEICRLLAGRLPGDLAFVREHSRRRAEQKFPLDAVLASHRCIQQVVVDAVRDAAIAVADESVQMRRLVAAVNAFAIEYGSAIGSLMTSEYVLQTRALAEAEGDQRSELMTTLLRGYDESDSRAAQLLRRAGYLEQRQSYCVVVARSVDPREMENAPRAQRMVDSVGRSCTAEPACACADRRE